MVSAGFYCSFCDKNEDSNKNYVKSIELCRLTPVHDPWKSTLQYGCYFDKNIKILTIISFGCTIYNFVCTCVTTLSYLFNFLLKYFAQM